MFACEADRFEQHREKEDGLDGLWDSRSRMDRSSFLSALCQGGGIYYYYYYYKFIHLKLSLPLQYCFLIKSKQILGSYKTDSKISEMLKHLDLYITPVLNMDGYIYSWKDNTVNLQPYSEHSTSINWTNPYKYSKFLKKYLISKHKMDNYIILSSKWSTKYVNISVAVT